VLPTPPSRFDDDTERRPLEWSHGLIVPDVTSYPLAVGHGASIDVTIRFLPSSPGRRDATLMIASNDILGPAILSQTTGDLFGPHSICLLSFGCELGARSRDRHTDARPRGRTCFRFGTRLPLQRPAIPLRAERSMNRAIRGVKAG
jgi:hypothetical protein